MDNVKLHRRYFAQVSCFHCSHNFMIRVFFCYSAAPTSPPPPSTPAPPTTPPPITTTPAEVKIQGWFTVRNYLATGTMILNHSLIDKVRPIVDAADC